MTVRTAYLAAPIDLSSSVPFQVEVNTITAALRAAGCSVFSPTAAWSPAPGQPNASLQSVNDAALEVCDAAVFVLPGVPTIGVTAELISCIQQNNLPQGGNKRLLLVVDPNTYERSWALAYLQKQLLDVGGSVLITDFGDTDLGDLGCYVTTFASGPSESFVARVSHTRTNPEEDND